MSQNNCKSCVHKVSPPPNAHCWRFRNEPAAKCRQWHMNLLPEITPVRRNTLEHTR